MRRKLGLLELVDEQRDEDLVKDLLEVSTPLACCLLLVASCAIYLQSGPLYDECSKDYMVNDVAKKAYIWRVNLQTLYVMCRSCTRLGRTSHTPFDGWHWWRCLPPPPIPLEPRTMERQQAQSRPRTQAAMTHPHLVRPYHCTHVLPICPISLNCMSGGEDTCAVLHRSICAAFGEQKLSGIRPCQNEGDFVLRSRERRGSIPGTGAGQPGGPRGAGTGSPAAHAPPEPARAAAFLPQRPPPCLHGCHQRSACSLEPSYNSMQ